MDGLKIISAIVIYRIWEYFLTKDRLMKGLLVATFYGISEMTWCRLTTGIYDTTIEQFVANVIYYPILIEMYRKYINDKYWRVMLFPINLWLYEIVLGYYFIWIFGKNTAWYYSDSSYTFFDNNIKLTFAPLWIGLGICQEMVFSYWERDKQDDNKSV